MCAEQSFYWSDDAVGDGVLSPYDNDEFSDNWRKLFQTDRTTQGVIDTYENELLVTNPAGLIIRIATGAALVDGKLYENDANVDNAILAPLINTRIDLVVLRKSWALQTVRIAIITGVEGAGVPGLTQTDGVIWEIPLAQVSITIVPTITITDVRVNVQSPLTLSPLSNVWVEIEEIVIVAQTEFDFISIPNTFEHLVIAGIVRHTQAAVDVNLGMTFNADVGANYNNQNIRGANAVASAAASAGDNEIDLDVIPAGNATANHVGYVMIRINNYAQEHFFKTIQADIGSIPTNVLANFDIGFETGVWRATTVIDQVTIFSPGFPAVAFAADSRLTLYGIT